MKKNNLGKTAPELKKEMEKYIKQSTKKLKGRLRAEWQKEKNVKKIAYV